jgi:hypothetical protein
LIHGGKYPIVGDLSDYGIPGTTVCAGNKWIKKSFIPRIKKFFFTFAADSKIRSQRQAGRTGRVGVLNIKCMGRLKRNFLVIQILDSCLNRAIIPDTITKFPHLPETIYNDFNMCSIF